MREYLAGYRAGDVMQRHGATKVLVLQYGPGTNLERRVRGISDRLAELGAASTVVALFLETDTKNHDLTADYIAKRLNSDATFDGVFVTSSKALPAILKSMNASRQVVFGTFDVNSAIIAGIAEGRVNFGIDQQQWLQGYMSVLMLMVRWLTGTKLHDHFLLTGPAYIDSASVNLNQLACAGFELSADRVGARDAQPFARGFPVCELKPARDCEPGFRLTLLHDCTPCGAGSFQPSAGRLPCQSCMAGTFAAGTGAQFCDECPVESFRMPLVNLGVCLASLVPLQRRASAASALCACWANFQM